MLTDSMFLLTKKGEQRIQQCEGRTIKFFEGGREGMIFFFDTDNFFLCWCLYKQFIYFFYFFVTCFDM